MRKINKLLRRIAEKLPRRGSYREAQLIRELVSFQKSKHREILGGVK